MSLKLYLEDNYPTIVKFLKFIKSNTINKLNAKKQQKILKVKGKETLQKLKEVFDSLNIEWFLVYGTLLGAYRDKDFISHDVDIDIGLFFDDYSKKIEQALLQKGFVKKHMFIVDNGEFAVEETYVYNGISIDIFYFKVENNNLIGYDFLNEQGLSWDKTIQKYGGLLVRELTFPYSGLMEYEFLGIKCKIPNEPEKHLASHYGDNFMYKDTKWNPAKVTNVRYLKDKIGQLIKYDY